MGSGGVALPRQIACPDCRSRPAVLERLPGAGADVRHIRLETVRHHNAGRLRAAGPSVLPRHWNRPVLSWPLPDDTGNCGRIECVVNTMLHARTAPTEFATLAGLTSSSPTFRPAPSTPMTMRFAAPPLARDGEGTWGGRDAILVL